eukprot:gene6041-6115_t
MLRQTGAIKVLVQGPVPDSPSRGRCDCDMDVLRRSGFDSDDQGPEDPNAFDQGYDHGNDQGAPGDDVIDTPPPVIGQDERRMQVRAYNYWAGLLGKRRFPAPDRLIAGDLPEFSGNAVLLHFDNGVEDPMVLALGAALAAECGDNQSIGRLSQVPGRSVLSRITDHYLQIIANEAPIGFEAEFVNLRGATILYRGILLPFSTDDATIDYIYGVINWKELADQRTTDALLHEIGQALDAPAHAPSRPPLRPLAGTRGGNAADGHDDDDLDDWAHGAGTWADGPVSSNLPLSGHGGDDADIGEATLDLSPFLSGQAGQGPTTAPRRLTALSAGRAAPAPVATPAPERPEPGTLTEWLETARASALRALANEDRTRQSLYAAIGRAWDFALAAEAAPDDYARLVAEAGLVMQDRAPLIPLVKLVFGADYDKTRLTEYATVLGHARRIGVARGALADMLAGAEGGLKAIIARERALRRGEDRRAAPERKAWAATARALPSRPISDLSREGAEFGLVLVRRGSDGDLAMLGEITDDAALLARATRHLAG